MPASGEKSTKVSAVASDGEFWVSKVLASVGQLEKDTKHVTLLVELDEDEQALCTKAKELAARLSNVRDLGYPGRLVLTICECRCPEYSKKQQRAVNYCCSLLSFNAIAVPSRRISMLAPSRFVILQRVPMICLVLMFVC